MSVEFRIGDVRRLLAELPAGSVDLIATSWPYHGQRDYLPKDHPMKSFEIGHEPTPAEYISVLLDITAEFRRVLAPHGSIATELGDGFCESGPGWPLARSLEMAPELYRVALAYGLHPLTGEPSPAGRWRVRNVVTHGRPNPPVGALGDKWRPACSYWAVACTGRRWFDLDAVRMEPTRSNRPSQPRLNHQANPKDINQRFGGLSEFPPANGGAPPLDWFEDDDELDQFERDLWTLPTSPYPGSHYATFSPELIRRFIVSMCPARVCRVCGKPSVRMTRATRVQPADDRQRKVKAAEYRTNGHDHPPELGWQMKRETLGWSDCGHGSDWRPCLVLDPFGGSGTTGMVAAGNGRDALLFDLDERCEALARERIGLYLAEQSRPEPQAEPTHEQGAIF